MELEKVTDWDFYDHIPSFPIRDAAYLWLDFIPPSGNKGYMPNPVELMQNEILVKKADGLQKVIEDCHYGYQAPVSRKGDTIKLELPEGESHRFFVIDPSIRIEREELLDLAKQKNMKPEFLFPEQRERTSPASSRERSDLDPRKRTTYLIIINALLKKLDIDSQERGSAGKVKEIVELAGLSRDLGTINTVLGELQELDDR